MIDWSTLLVPIRRRWAGAGRLLLVSEFGEIEREIGRSGRLSGSWSSSVEISPHDVDGRPYVRIDGNPAKWFQGHNIDGIESPRLLRRFGRVVCARAGLSIAGGHWYLNRVDVTRSFRLPTDDDAAAWVRGLDRHATVQHRGRGVLTGGTWYLGKHSRRWSLKAYAKRPEMRAHRPRGYSSFSSPSWSDLVDWAEGVVRIELCIRRPELVSSGYRNLRAWNDGTSCALWDMYMSRVCLPENGRRLALDDLSSAARGVYYAWRAGEHLPSIYSRAAFYRWRRHFLDRYNIDIATDPAQGGEVVPLVRTLRADPVSAPSSWLYAA